MEVGGDPGLSTSIPEGLPGWQWQLGVRGGVGVVGKALIQKWVSC